MKPSVKGEASAQPKQAASLISKPSPTPKMPSNKSKEKENLKSTKIKPTKNSETDSVEIIDKSLAIDEHMIELSMPIVAIPTPAPEKKPSRSKNANRVSEKPSAAGLEAMRMPEGKGAAAFAMQPKVEKPIIKPSTKKVRYSDADLKIFKAHINKLKDDALDEMRMLKERLDDLTNSELASESMIYSMHMAEQGSEALEKEKTYAQMNRLFDYIKKLDDALKRIDDKTYGICKECNILIAKARLLAVPITTQSASYKIHGQCPEDGIDKIAGR